MFIDRIDSVDIPPAIRCYVGNIALFRTNNITYAVVAAISLKTPQLILLVITCLKWYFINS